MIDGSSYAWHLPDLISQINQFAAAIKCVYPEYSTPACAGSNPCGFTCIDGFSSFPTNNPTTCICSAPSVICNGQCVAPGACPSQALTTIKKKRRWVGSGSCTDIGPGWVACGVLGAGPRAWECINAARDLESCKRLFFLLSYSTLFSKLMDLLHAKVVAACFPSRPTLPSAKIARRYPVSLMSRVWVANASSTAACPDTCSLSTARAASTFCSLNLPIWRTCLPVPMDSNTLPLGGTELPFTLLELLDITFFDGLLDYHFRKPPSFIVLVLMSTSFKLVDDLGAVNLPYLIAVICI